MQNIAVQDEGRIPTNPVREVEILESAANRTTSVPDPSHLMTIGLLGLDRLRSPLRTEKSVQANPWNTAVDS